MRLHLFPPSPQKLPACNYFTLKVDTWRLHVQHLDSAVCCPLDMSSSCSHSRLRHILTWNKYKTRGLFVFTSCGKNMEGLWCIHCLLSFESLCQKAERIRKKCPHILKIVPPSSGLMWCLWVCWCSTSSAHENTLLMCVFACMWTIRLYLSPHVPVCVIFCAGLWSHMKVPLQIFCFFITNTTHICCFKHSCGCFYRPVDPETCMTDGLEWKSPPVVLHQNWMETLHNTSSFLLQTKVKRFRGAVKEIMTVQLTAVEEEVLMWNGGKAESISPRLWWCCMKNLYSAKNKNMVS